MNLEQLPGVGPQLAARIRARFKRDADFFAAVERLDLQAIATVEGLSERRAVDLVLAARGDEGSDRFLATPAARKVHDRILQRLLRYAATDTGRNRLRLLHPLPTSEAADAHIRRVLDAKQATLGVDADAVRRDLRKLHPERATTPRMDGGTLTVATDDATFDRLHALGIGRWTTLGSLRDLAEAEAYDLVVLVGDGEVESDVPHSVEISAESDPALWCPARTIEAATQHLEVLAACSRLAKRFGRPSVAEDVLALLERPSGAAGDPKALRRAVEETKALLDADLESRMADLQLPAQDLLRAFTAGRLPPALQAVMDDVLQEGRRLLRVRTGVAFQPYTAGLPLSIDEDEVDRVLEAMQATRRIDAFHRDQETAKRLAALHDDVWDEVRAWLEFDAEFALGCFARDHDLHAPHIGSVLAFADSIHLDLAMGRQVQRIAYRLGGSEHVAVMTGANSGGKSTLLEHLSQLVIMARLGLPVVGRDVEVPWLDEVHLVTARRGMDAGAFETFLRGFLPVTKGDAKRLVLADEVESITELEAAGRILAFVLDRLAATDSLAVVVTHLAPQVLAHVQDASVRVDGIEATGLDDQHRLVVDRCPKMGRAARSTPELIIQRLAATTTGAERDLYRDLLAVFQ